MHNNNEEGECDSNCCGVIRKWIKNNPQKIGANTWVERSQKRTLLGTSRVLRKVLENVRCPHFFTLVNFFFRLSN